VLDSGTPLNNSCPLPVQVSQLPLQLRLTTFKLRQLLVASAAVHRRHAVVNERVLLMPLRGRMPPLRQVPPSLHTRRSTQQES